MRRGVRRGAHSLKSNGALFGATEFANLCLALENQGREGGLDGAMDRRDLIEAEYRHLAAALQTAGSSGGSSSIG